MPVKIDGSAAGSITPMMGYQRLKPYTFATSRKAGGTLRRPSQVLTTTGTSAASDKNTTLATSPRPNHTEISGIQANSEICLNVLKLGPTSRSNRREKPSRQPSTRPKVVPMKKPLRFRARLDEMARQNCPDETCSHAVIATFSGETSRPDVLQP